GCLMAAFVFLLFLFKWINILKEYERAVTFWLGRLSTQPKGPGLVLIFWPFETMVRISLRTIVHDVPSQDIITKDNVSVKVNAVVYFKVVQPDKAVVQVENYLYATSQLAQTTLRSVLGQATLDELLSERDKLNLALQQVSFTARQALVLFVGLLLALGLAYFLGIMTGLVGREGPAAVSVATTPAVSPTREAPSAALEGPAASAPPKPRPPEIASAGAPSAA